MSLLKPSPLHIIPPRQKEYDTIFQRGIMTSPLRKKKHLRSLRTLNPICHIGFSLPTINALSYYRCRIFYCLCCRFRVYHYHSLLSLWPLLRFFSLHHIIMKIWLKIWWQIEIGLGSSLLFYYRTNNFLFVRYIVIVNDEFAVFVIIWKLSSIRWMNTSISTCFSGFWDT